MEFLIVFVAATAVAVALTPVAKRLSVRLGIVAVPGGRRRHRGQIPLLGGIPVFGGYLAGILIIYWLLPPEFADDVRRLQGVLLGTAVLFVGGLIDDRYELSPRWQFGVQLLAAVIAMSQIVFIERFTNPLPSSALWLTPPLSYLFDVQGELVIIWRPLAYLFTLFWVLGMINAVNWLDGLDGLAAGVGTIAALLFAWHSYRLDQTAVAAFPLALAGALIGFLFFNFAPASIFLGTAGAWLLGYNLATLSILSPAKLSTALMVMAIPILDVAWQIIDRLRRGQHPYQGDRGHLHFRLVDSGLPTQRIVLGYYAVALTFGLVAIFVENRLAKIGIWLLLVLVVLLFFAWLARRPSRR